MYGSAERGFTLIEALVSLLLVSLAVVVMVRASARTLWTQNSAERHVEAVALADSKLNEIVLFPADSLAWYAQVRSGQFSLGRRRYAWRAIVRREDNKPLWQAAVSIEWGGGAFDVETVFYRRRIARMTPGVSP